MVNEKMYAGFFNYIHFLSEKYGVWITIKDRVNFLSYLDKTLSMAMVPYLNHQNCYCSFIKSNEDTFQKCICMLDKIDEKYKKTKEPFWGVCHAGVCEYIVPIFAYDKYLGFITVGPVKSEERIAKRCLKRLCKEDEDTFTRVYQMYKSVNICSDLEEIKRVTGILTEYIALLYPRNQVVADSKSSSKSEMKEKMTLDRALAYIHKNYYEYQDLKHIAAYCNCSKSYISHMFKKQTGLSLSMYLTYLRVNEAKKRLLETSEPITQIAIVLGFGDSNYFSKVFKKLNGISPKEYRSRRSE